MSGTLPSLDTLTAAADIVYRAMPATPQYSWPLINRWIGTEVWLKHENHTPVGAFKVRGGLVYINRLCQREPQIKGVIAATRGNHGQSIAFGAARHGLTSSVVVPIGNSQEKNLAMRNLGAQLIEYGKDFQESREYAMVLAKEQHLHMVPSYHHDLVAGVGTYWMEFFRDQPELDVVYVPVGQGSGICGAIAAREALQLKTRIIGVVSAHALAYQLSFAERKVVESPVTTAIADGLACRVADAESLEHILRYVDEIVSVTDEEVAQAMLGLYVCTHNLAEGAGAAGLAAIAKHADKLKGKRVGTPVSGGNVDREAFAKVLQGSPPFSMEGKLS